MQNQNDSTRGSIVINKQGEHTQKNEAKEIRRIRKLFDRMAVIFGRFWSYEYPTLEMQEAAVYEWGSATKNITSETMLRVLEHLRTDANLERPPNLSRFMGLCAQFRAESPRRHELPKPVSDKGPDGKTVPELMRAATKRSHKPLSASDPEKFQEMVAAHEALIQRDRYAGKIRDAVPLRDNHLCAYPGCTKPGTRTSATCGSGTWYCGVHIND